MTQFIQSNINFVVTTLTLLSNIVFVGVIGFMFFDRKFKDLVFDFVNKHILKLIFVTSATAMIGSLVYSTVVGFPPCELCWIQRIFMFPQPILTLLAMRKKDKSIVDYLLVLSILGGAVALYHSLSNLGIGDGVVGCTSLAGDCAKLYVLEYGYITIPFMSFSIFAYLIGISIIYYKSRNVRI
ncbi:MAG: disulfide bond formation protein B [Parcubacteria group bacterium]